MIRMLLFNLNQKLVEHCFKVVYARYFIILLATKPAETEITDNACKHIKGMAVEVLSGRVRQLESLSSEIQENAFLFLVYNPFLHMKFTGFSITHTNTTVSSSSDVMAQKNHSFESYYFKGN